MKRPFHSAHPALFYILLLIVCAVTMQAQAAGFVSLPSAGFPTEGGVSAYRLCNTSDNFGVGVAKSPEPGIHDECAVFPASELAAPLPGFKVIGAGVRNLLMANSFTGGKDKHIGNVTEFVWRNAEKTECIFGSRIVLSHNNAADYDAGQPGSQFFKVNDLARGGFAGLPVEVAYSIVSKIAKPLYRVGRTYTSVQYRGYSSTPAPGYSAQPLTTPAYSLAINGLPQAESISTPKPEQQSASLNDDWVNFTTYASAGIENRTLSSSTGMFYIKTACTDAPLKVEPGVIRLRQTVPPMLEISAPGFVPQPAKPLNADATAGD
ncbi:hypothetical protein [Methylobacillus flagellatus]|uniref:hypothetical protein n=1 Tax=Methylobacillus flagellatus TaxID=405 RepID=UPI0010F488D8|nr:hypothetical protein [Methylobacillus flagellatus]